MLLRLDSPLKTGFPHHSMNIVWILPWIMAAARNTTAKERLPIFVADEYRWTDPTRSRNVILIVSNRPYLYN